MQSKENIISSSLKETFSAINSNKRLFLILFILQVIFLSVMFYLNLHYQMPLLERSKVIIDYINTQDLDEMGIAQRVIKQENILGTNSMILETSYNDLVEEYRNYLFVVFLVIIVFTSLAYSFALRMIGNPNINQSLKKIFIISGCYYTTMFLFFYSIFAIAVSEVSTMQERLTNKYLPMMLILSALFYFMFVSYSISSKTKLEHSLVRTLEFGIKKIHYFFAVHLINFAMFFVSISMIIFSLERSVILNGIGILVFILTFIVGRIFMLKVGEKLASS